MKERKIYLVALFLIALFCNNQSFCKSNTESIKIFSDTILQRKLYTEAYTEINDMLQNKKPLNLKRAVFIIENAYVGGTMNYQTYSDEISKIALTLKKMIKDKNIEKYKTSTNWAVFSYMTEPTIYNNYKPYTYDFKDFFGDSSWTSLFVTKLIKTNVGQCHSLPLLYKILCNEINGTSFIAFAPSHLYIKHIDENGKWVSLELTNGSIAREEWIMEESAITVSQIQS